jgi:hypothetical protein|tara:strand:- start:239 stop:454 length:216 start_codon:yes stop_codon:yes gene_type:complete
VAVHLVDLQVLVIQVVQVEEQTKQHQYLTQLDQHQEDQAIRLLYHHLKVFLEEAQRLSIKQEELVAEGPQQ